MCCCCYGLMLMKQTIRNIAIIDVIHATINHQRWAWNIYDTWFVDFVSIGKCGANSSITPICASTAVRVVHDGTKKKQPKPKINWCIIIISSLSSLSSSAWHLLNYLMWPSSTFHTLMFKLFTLMCGVWSHVIRYYFFTTHCLFFQSSVNRNQLMKYVDENINAKKGK